MRSRDLRFKTKQLIAFSMVLVVFLAASSYMLHRMTGLKETFEDVATNWMPRSVAIAELSRGISNYRTLALQHALTEDSTVRNSLEMLINLQIDQIVDYLDRYQTLRDESSRRGLLPAKEDSLYEMFDSYWDEYQSHFQEWFQLAKQNKKEAAQALIAKEGAILHDDIRFILEELVENINEESSKAAAKAEEMHVETRKMFLLLFIISLGVSALIAIGMTRLIVRPLNELAKATEEVSRGNLEQHLDVAGKDEIGILAKSFNSMAKSLKEARDKTEEQALILRRQNTQLEMTLKKLSETQEELLLKEKMASLGKLVASIAHEINNPIGSIIGAADVSQRAIEKLKQSLETLANEQALKIDKSYDKIMSTLDSNFALTLTAGQRIAAIIRSLKNFSKLDEAEYQTVDIHEGIESSLVMLGQRKLSHVKIVKQFGRLKPLGCYPGLLNQAFINILTNAAEAIRESGTITINTDQNNGEIIVKITDSGIGISKERLKNLFEFGFSTDASRVKMGTGLLTAYNIVQKHGGRIEVASELGRGSTFSIIIPELDRTSRN